MTITKNMAPGSVRDKALSYISFEDQVMMAREDPEIVKLLEETECFEEFAKEAPAVALALPERLRNEWHKAARTERLLKERVFSVGGITLSKDMVEGGNLDQEDLCVEWMDSKAKTQEAYHRWVRAADVVIWGLNWAKDNGYITEEARRVWNARYVDGRSMGQIADDSKGYGNARIPFPLTKSRVQYLLNMKSNKEAWNKAYTEYARKRGYNRVDLNTNYIGSKE